MFKRVAGTKTTLVIHNNNTFLLYFPLCQGHKSKNFPLRLQDSYIDSMVRSYVKY